MIVPRVALCLVLAVAAGAAAWIVATSSQVTTDFEFYWLAARHWASGQDPYLLRPNQTDWPLQDPLFYPLPALMMVWPVHALPESWAVALFIGLPSLLLAWRVTRHELWPLLLFASPSFWCAAFLGQWSPWLVLGMIAPWAGATLICKPSLGLACLVGRPSRGALIGCAALGLASLVIWPGWVPEWRSNLSMLEAHTPPLFTWWGCWLGLAAVRWRTGDGRLVLAFSAVPQLLFYADQLPLLLVAKSRRELAFLVAAAWLVALMWLRSTPQPFLVPWAAPYVLLGVYLPALYLVLRRRSEHPEHSLAQDRAAENKAD